ncbi:MBG domain-containing protein [Gilvimarinus polysaccharolyticus]|uniref:MBG domain-containing protein n=1 Tax=Gilvimarinus polysaccharolyticus TaxID=863921 RepID=UPI000673AEA6|nr:MBG domain-containing protein [Gilvimarinus polysaccharolyticus]
MSAKPKSTHQCVCPPYRSRALALTIALISGAAYAGPNGGVVIDGDANIDIRGKLTDILQNTQNTTIVWDNFDINIDEIVNFIQPNDTSIALNRVFSADGTQINGQLNANGRVFVMDANGVLFGQSASVNVGSLVASTLDVSHTDYTNFTFSGNGAPASVLNLGAITAADTGAVALLGGQVSNRGVIQAKLGNVALAAGNQITLDFAGDGLLNVQVDEAALNALAENHGLIQTPGGQVLMTAHASDALLQTVVNNTGVIEAQSLQAQDGKIMLLGGFNGGTVNVSGTLDASAPNSGNGGFIETSGAVVQVTANANIDASSANGSAGTWLLDPTDLDISYDEMGADDGVSHVHTQALQNSLAGSNVILQTADAGAGNGDITIADPIIWASANTLTLDADGGIVFNDYVQAPNGGLNLTALADITSGAEGHINVAAFTLESGNFSQIMATLPTFMADDFTLNGGTFTRATGGNGTGSPLQITDIFGLQGLATTLNLSATLQNDIDASDTAGWNSGAGFDPIGNSSIPYSATFDGAGFVIDGLTINRPAENFVALFGHTSSTASISRLGVTEGQITGDYYVGGLVARNRGDVSLSYTTGTVIGDTDVGGLVGNNTNGSVDQSYSTSAVTGDESVAGLVGNNAMATVTQSYASGLVTGGFIAIGGLVGYNFNGTVNNSYWDSFTTNQPGVGVPGAGSIFNATAVNGDWSGATDAYDQASYEVVGQEFDFANTWFIAEGSSRPMLRAFLDGGNISNLYQLQGMAADLTGSYILLNDIDASATASTDNADVWGGRGFAPVGHITPGGAFTGELDGQGFQIGGLTINRPALTGVGLFGVATGATFSDLSLTGINIVGDVYVGGVVGQDGLSSISDVDVAGDVAGGSGVGGLIGGSNTSSIVGSYSDVNVAGVASSGGLVGLADGLTVNTSYAVGEVSGETYSGGLVGVLRAAGSITDSFATGAVEATTNYAGGLVGHLENATIVTSWASGEVATAGASSGGLVARDNGGNTYTNNYWDSFTTAQADATGAGGVVAGITAVTGDWSVAETAYSAGSYTGFDFGNAWFIAEGHSRPMLRAFLSGGGEIHNLYDLQGMAADLAGSYTLMTDIDASATASTDNADVWGGLGFAPVGNSVEFSGDFDGNNHVISNLTINRPEAGYVGLFGRTNGAIISDVGLTQVNIVGTNTVGALVGMSLNGSISEVFSSGQVTGENTVGGLAGLNDSSVSNSYSVAQVNGDDNVGGLVGTNNFIGSISQSYATGVVTGTSSVGGLVGHNENSVVNSFWNVDTTGVGIGSGPTAGAAGLTTTEFTNLANFTSWGADIDAEGGTGSVWRIYEGQSTPLLRSFLTEIDVIAYDDYKVYDGVAYDGLHDINATTGAGVRYGNSYAEFVAAFGENGTPYGSDDINSADLEYTGDSQGAIDAGTYDITPSELWSNQSGYDIVMNDGVLTIDQAVVSVTVKINNASKEYGEADPTFSWGVTSGSLGAGDRLTGRLSRAPGENVGNYAITGNVTGDLASGNYDVTLINGVFTITPRAITVNIADLDKIYGDDDPSFSWSITGGSLAAGETLNGTLTRVPGENVGDYVITGALEGDLASSNYTVTVDDGVLSIAPRPLVISADDFAKIYGQDDPELTWSQGGSVVEGDTLTVSLSRSEGQNVGYYTITPEVTGDVLSDNYALSINNGALQITPAALMVTANDIETYWNLLPPFSATLDGLTNGDTEQDVFGNSLTVTSDLSLPIPGAYTLTPMATLASSNYTVSFNDGVLNLLSSNPGGGYGDGLTSTQLPAREALGRQDRANLFEGRDLLTGELDDISLGVYQDGVRVPAAVLAEFGLPMPRAVLFANNSDTVEPEYVEMLEKFVAKLAQYPEFNLLVEGHTSHTGPRLLNEKLARKRAMAVYNILVELGVEPARLGTKGFSWTRPIADNSTLEGQALNRRTEITPDKPSADQDASE